MDSKKKFKKNRYWKQKYKPRNPTSASTGPTEQSGLQNNKSLNPSDESDSDEDLKQPVPVGGWFPESDPSSSDSENLELVLPSSKSKSLLDLKDRSIKPQKLSNSSDQDTEFSPTKSIETDKGTCINSNRDQKQFITKEVATAQLESKNCGLGSSYGTTKPTKNDRSCSDNDEEELEFLLSLKDPTHTSPMVIESLIGNERRLAVSSNNLAQQGPVKTIDLEKWLDSVLDD